MKPVLFVLWSTLLTWVVLIASPIAQTCGEVEELPWIQVHDLSDDGEVVVGETSQLAVMWTATSGVAGLGVLPLPGHTRSVASGVNANGTVVVGTSIRPAHESRAFRWTATGGLYDLGVLPGYDNSSAAAVSADGQFVVGSLGNTGSVASQVFRWTQTTGMQLLGAFTPTAVSADGSVVVGYRDGPQGPRAIRWTSATGEQDLGTLGGPHAYAWDVSADGQVVVGVAGSAVTSNRAFRWTAASGMQDLGTLGGVTSIARAVSGDGLVVIGDSAPGPVPHRAFRWSVSGSMQDLGIGHGGLSEGLAVSYDGTVVVGQDYTTQRGFRLKASQLGASFCGDAVANSTGCVGRLRVSGSSSVIANTFTLSVEHLSRNSFGFFITSRNQGSTFPVGNSQGRLCLGGFIGRFVGPSQIKNSGTSGSFSLAIDLTTMPTPFGSVSAQSGETWHFQAWHRDANPTLTSNFTDAVSVTFQ